MVCFKGAVREIGKLGSNRPFSDADHTDMFHFGLSGFYIGVLVHQSIPPQDLEDDGGWSCPTTVGVVRRRSELSDNGQPPLKQLFLWGPDCIQYKV